MVVTLNRLVDYFFMLNTYIRYKHNASTFSMLHYIVFYVYNLSASGLFIYAVEKGLDVSI